MKLVRVMFSINNQLWRQTLSNTNICQTNKSLVKQKSIPTSKNNFCQNLTKVPNKKSNSDNKANCFVLGSDQYLIKNSVKYQQNFQLNPEHIRKSIPHYSNDEYNPNYT